GRSRRGGAHHRRRRPGGARAPPVAGERPRAEEPHRALPGPAVAGAARRRRAGRGRRRHASVPRRARRVRAALSRGGARPQRRARRRWGGRRGAGSADVLPVAVATGTAVTSRMAMAGALLGVLFLARIAGATTYYVKQGPAGTGTGTQADPWGTIQQAANVV